MNPRSGWRALRAWFHRLGHATVILSALAVVLVLLSSTAADARVPITDPVTSVHVDVIGDSLSTGFRTPGDTWPEQAQSIFAAKGLKATITNASENGAGYVVPGEGGDVYLDLVNRIVNSQSQVVLLFGSDNDSGASGLDAAVATALARVKVLAPAATVIVVGPTSESGDVQGELAPIIQTLKVQADDDGVQYVDPVALGWFQGESSGFLTDDLEHPNTAGETYLAQRMATILAPAIKDSMHQDQLKRSAHDRSLGQTLGAETA
ncbi:SGNH/GDSL hydrolase family protein [Arthrobacter cryoconiti]|uniref:SGNH/GDSL hydrolase family protein n=1 Tax=Arthrobacter cryoconiti TaxID=748907 RepID=A0ABV8R233_9MICC|nr:SGNH/GDSL hydrolase family protein [Arthrobacter cryoconiti]